MDLGIVQAKREEVRIEGPKATRFGWQIRVCGYTLIALFLFGVLELLSYTYLRVVDGYDGRHLMNYQFDDYKNIRLTPNFSNSKGIYHNPQGFRRNESTQMETPPGRFRIFIMGGSTAYGLGSLSRYGQEKYSIIRNDQTIDFYLERYLNGLQLPAHVEVINAAITSHYSHHHLIYLNQTILKFHPDMVIFIDGFNDYYPYEKGFDQFRDYAYQERVHQFMSEPTINAFLGYSGWWAFRKSHFIYLTAKTLRPVWLGISRIGRHRVRIDVDEALRNLQENAEANFVKLVERNGLILRQENVIPVFTLQPEIVFQQSKILSPMEQKISEEMTDQWQENFVEFKNKAKPIVLDCMRRATQTSGAHFLDLTDIFGGMEEDVYTDYCHLTPMGNKRLAEELAPKILPLVLERLKRRESPATSQE